ncbi:Coiled-coil domain-containing protein 40 [Chamberlinius hualienensis]
MNVNSEAEPSVNKRFDDVLQKHLQKHKEKLTFDHLHLVKELKCKKKEREELGVRLYDIQTKSERQFEIYKKFSRQLDELTSKRDEVEKSLERSKLSASETRKLIENEEKNVSEVYRRIDILNAEVLKLLTAKNSLESNAKALDHAQSKFSTDRRQLHSLKAFQEDCINHLVQTADRIQEKIVMHNFNIDYVNSQTNEIKLAENKEKMELEAIDIERKNLVKQWDYAAKSLHQKDDTLASIADNINKKNREIEFAKTTRKNSAKSLIAIEDVNMELNLKLNQFSSSVEGVVQRIEHTFNQRQMISSEIIDLKCQIGKLEGDLTSQIRTKARKDKEVSILEKSIQEATYETQHLETKLRSEILNRSVTDVVSQKILKKVEEIQENKSLKDQERVNVERELLILEIEMGRKRQEINQMENEVKNYEAELKEDDKDIRNIKGKLQQGLVILEKKTKFINEMQSQIDSFSSSSSQSASEVDVEMQGLAKELQENIRLVDELKQLWLKQQKVLVRHLHDKDICFEECHQLENQLNVYRQRNRRVKDSVKSLLDENREIERKIENFYLRIHQLNSSAVSDQTEMESKINDELVGKNELIEKLKESEEKLNEKNQLLEQIKEDQPQLRQQIEKSEEELKQWQVKLNEIKETKSVIDAEYKSGEIRFLADHLHKMKVQYSNLCQHRGFYAKELEKSVNRWDTLLTKSGIIANDSKSRNVTSVINGLERQANILKKRIKSLDMENKSLDDDLKSVSGARLEVESAVENKKISVKQLKLMLDENSSKLATMSYQKLKSFEELVIYQQQLKHYQEIKDTSYQPVSRSESVVNAEIDKQKKKSEQLSQLLDSIQLELDKSNCNFEILSKFQRLKCKCEAIDGQFH